MDLLISVVIIQLLSVLSNNGLINTANAGQISQKQNQMSMKSTSKIDRLSLHMEKLFINANSSRVTKLEVLRSNWTDSNQLAYALVSYFDATNDVPQGASQNYVLSISEIESVLARINPTLAVSSVTSFVTSHSTESLSPSLGAYCVSGIPCTAVTKSNLQTMLSSHLTAAAILEPDSLVRLLGYNMLIINNPTSYNIRLNTDNTKMLVSSLVSVAARSKHPSRLPTSSVIRLFFTIKVENKLNYQAKYLCAAFDKNNLTWNEKYCTQPIYNSAFGRYECICHHTATFGLIRVKQSMNESHINEMYFDRQVMPLIIALSIAIVCFLLVFLHMIFTQCIRSKSDANWNDFFKLIPFVSTAFLFSFYIALVMNVHIHKLNLTQMHCFTNTTWLVFIVYFLFIGTLGIKTSVSCFQSMRFISSSNKPTFGLLVFFLIIAIVFAIAITLTAMYTQSHSPLNIITLFPYRPCWFVRQTVHYFLTLPIGIFLLINIFSMIITIVHVTKYVRNNTQAYKGFQLMKWYILLLTESCLIQCLSWLIGSVVFISTTSASNLLGWFFAIFNGLEGLWCILIYINVKEYRAIKKKSTYATHGTTVEPSAPYQIEGQDRDDNRESTMAPNIYPSLSALSGNRDDARQV